MNICGTSHDDGEGHLPEYDPSGYGKCSRGRCIIPIQDYLQLDNSARINQPSTLGTNWKVALEGRTVQQRIAEGDADSGDQIWKKKLDTGSGKRE